MGVEGVALTSLSSKEDIATIYKRLEDPQGGIRLLYGESQHSQYQAAAYQPIKSMNSTNPSIFSHFINFISVYPI